MNTPAVISDAGLCVAILVGVVTAVVSSHAAYPRLGGLGIFLGVMAGCLCTLGFVSNIGGSMSAILIPYEALGICIVGMLLIKPLLSGKVDRGRQPQKPIQPVSKVMDDPWDAELRKNGPKAKELTMRKRPRRR